MPDTVEPELPRSDGMTRQSPRVVPYQPGNSQRAAALLLVLLIKSVAATVRRRFDDTSGFFEPPPAGQAIYACWHNRLALCLTCYFDYASPRNSTRGLAAMVSASRDGAFLAAVLEAFKVQPVRGSSSRRGRQALLEMSRWAERGYDLAITPDGPRGPRYHVQPGIISLAQVTGLPIIPFSFHLAWKIQIKSWDRFQVPLPFTGCTFHLRQPIWVPRTANDEQRKELRERLEQEMRAITVD